MSLLHALLAPKTELECRGQRVLLRSPRVDDFVQWRDLRLRSQDFLTPWEPTWGDDEMLLSSFRKRVAHYSRMAHDDMAYPFFVFDVTGVTLLGALTLSNVRRGVAQMATLGYWIGMPHAKQGYMTDALNAVMNYARVELELHRLEASCLPANAASIKLLHNAGFTREGFARDYLKINGRWEDHVLWGLSIN